MATGDLYSIPPNSDPTTPRTFFGVAGSDYSFTFWDANVATGDTDDYMTVFITNSEGLTGVLGWVTGDPTKDTSTQNYSLESGVNPENTGVPPTSTQGSGPH